MARFVYTQTAFNAGELAPRVGKRVDRDQFQRGMRTCKNFQVTPQGPIERRRGTRYVAETKDSSTASRLIPFVFSDIDSYAMEFGVGYIRFFRSFNVVTNDDVGAGGTGTDPYEISTSYTESDLFNIKWVQDGDVMYLVCGGTSIRPQKLVRQSTGQFTISDFENLNGPVLDVIEQDISISSDHATGSSRTITATNDLFEAGHVGSLWEMRNSSGTSASRSYFRITAFTSSTEVTADIVNGSAQTSNTAYWGEAAWSGVRGYPKAIAFHESRLAFGGTNESPLRVDFSKSNANYEDFDYADVNNSDAMNVTLAGQRNTIQSLVSDTNFLVAPTYGGVAFIGSGSATTALTPETIQARNGEDYGSSSLQALKFNNGIKYIQAKGERLYQTEYDDISIKYKNFNLSSLHDEILAGGAVEMAVQVEPYEVLWIVKNDGELVGLLQEDEQQVLAYQRWSTDGEIESVTVVPNSGQDQVWAVVNRTVDGATVRYVEYIEPDRALNYYVDSGVEYNGLQTETLTLSATTGTGITATAGGSLFSSSDVGRKIFTFDTGGTPVGRATITGFTSVTEVTVDITVDFSSTSISASGWYLTATVISGLDHLEGKTVQVSADGYFAGEYTVTAGDVVLTSDKAAAVAYIGLKFESDVEPMPIEGGSRDGPAVTKPKRINRVGYSVYETQGFKSGRDFDNLKTIPSRKASGLMNAPVEEFGADFIEDLVRSFSGRWERDPSVCIRQDFPAPLTVAALTYYMETNDT